MKFVDEFRQPDRLRRQLEAIRTSARHRWVIMDVCGGQTHAFLRFGLEAALDDVLELIHGPGCPVCVTPAEVIDTAIELASDRRVLLATFGDMLRVPATSQSLLQARAQGALIKIVYSPLDALQLAVAHPDREVVFLAVGFETTVPATALAVLQARRRGISNFSVLSHHVRVEPAMRAILQQSDCRVHGFLAAGHVCTVTGFSHYQALVDEFEAPVVVTGFEPVDLLAGVEECVRLLEAGTPGLSNQYTRSARPEGNPEARRMIETVFEVSTLPWRGMGEICEGGLSLRPEFAAYDCRQRFSMPMIERRLDVECRSADVLAGRIKPTGCPLFRKGCDPDSPRGAPMVSSEGACAAYYQYMADGEAIHE